VDSPVVNASAPKAGRLLAAAMVLGVLAGCRLVPRRGPVPPELADARRLSHEGLSAADRQDLARAEELLGRAVQSCPVDVDARRHYADVLWRRGRRMEAVAQITKALELSPLDAGLCVEGGSMYLELGLLTEAERLSSEAVRLAPRSAKAWHLHGQLWVARGQFEPALADFLRGLALAPDDRALLQDVAEAYLQLDRPRRALAMLAMLGEAYGSETPPVELLVMEASAQESLGRLTEAAESYRRVLARPDAPPGMADRLAALGRVDGAAIHSSEMVRPVSRSNAPMDGTSRAAVAKP
jgi:tetratricopeptide (TPR) repeat protein